MHKNLKRQLQRVYGDNISESPEFRQLLELISDTYEGRDSEYELIERSLEISSKELTELNEKLRAEKLAVEQIVEKRTKELSQERSKLEKIAENMETGAILFDQHGTVAFINHTARKLIGFDTEPPLETVLPKLYQTFSSYPIADYVTQCLAGTEGDLKDVETELATYELKFQVLSKETGYLIWIKDVTNEKLLERSKNELLAIASHQLRSPLTVVKGNTEMLLDESFGSLNDEQKKIMQQIAQSNENMIRLIQQMLDITKISQQNLQFNLTTVPIEEVLQQVVEDLTPYAAKYHVTISTSLTPDSGLTIQADKTRLYQVFQNLIENAIKYSDPETGDGIVTIALAEQDEKVVVRIQDTGIGIPKNEQGKLFERFYRASNASKFVPDGSGLGLYIVKSIVELINGTIEFTSVEGEGTTFTLTFSINK